MGKKSLSVGNFRAYYSSGRGFMVHGDSLELMREMADESVDLIMTSPPFGLVRKKSYGNVDSDEYVAWFRDFGVQFQRILKPTGSLVIDIGGAWIPGQPTARYQQLLICSARIRDTFPSAQDSSGGIGKLSNTRRMGELRRVVSKT